MNLRAGLTTALLLALAISSASARSNAAPASSAAALANRPARAAAGGEACNISDVTLVRVRGSGDGYGKADHLQRWDDAATQVLKPYRRITRLEVRYDAPPVPSSKNPLAWKRFRDVATRQAPDVRRQLLTAGCPGADMVIAGYSQGAILLRAIVPGLSAEQRRRIRNIDLIADPTADGRVDSALQHPADLGGRATAMGIDTFGGRTKWTFIGGAVGLVGFKQNRYPSDVAARTAQYCLPFDAVCDANPLNLAKFTRAGGRAVHDRYQFERIGHRAAKQIITGPRYMWTQPGPWGDASPEAAGRGVEMWKPLARWTVFTSGTGDLFVRFERMRWRGWGTREASASGSLTSCYIEGPTCETPIPVRLVLSRPQTANCGDESIAGGVIAYTRYRLTGYSPLAGEFSSMRVC